MDALLQCYVVIDIESISLDRRKTQWKGKFSKMHNCKRKVAVKCYDSLSQIFELRPCIERKELMWTLEQISFRYCQGSIHGLSYYPFFSSLPCLESETIIGEYLESKAINQVLYKGGTVEKSLWDVMGIKCRNLEQFDVRRYKKQLHDPRKEMRFFRERFIKIITRK